MASPKRTLAKSLVLAAAGLAGCKLATRPASPVASFPLHYQLEVVVVPADHELHVHGAVQSNRPRQRFYLNKMLTLDDLADKNGPISYKRNGGRIDLDRPVTTVRIRYHGRLTREGEQDFKSDAWIQPGEV